MDVKELIEEPDVQSVISPFAPQSYVKKSNFLISAKYQSTLLENQLLLMSLQNVRENSKGELVSLIPSTQIMKLLNKQYGEFYTQLQKVAMKLLKNVVMIEDEEKKWFHASNIVSDAISSEGNFIVKFNNTMKPLIMNLTMKYTPLDTRIMIQFTSTASFRLYEVLKSKCYYPKYVDEDKKTNVFQHEFDLAELKVTLGAVDLSDERIARIINDKKNPDYDKLLKDIQKMSEKDKTINKPKYSTWYDFKRYILDKAVPEINEKSDIFVEYDVVRKGYGGKISKIIFTISNVDRDIVIENDEVVPVEEPSAEKLMELIEKADEIFDGQLVLKDVKAVLKASGYNLDKIKKAYKIAREQSGIHNLAGWLIRAVENNYEAPVKNKKKDKNSSYMEREYDFDALEKELLANG